MSTTSKLFHLLLLTSSPSPSFFRLLPPLSLRRFPHSSFPLKLKPFSASSSLFHTRINSNPLPPPPPQSIWPPEFSLFLNNISSSSYSSNLPQYHFRIHAFNFPVEFINAANASLGFAHKCGHLIGRLSRRDIEVVIENGNAGLFENGDEILDTVRAFFTSQSGSVLNANSEAMVDLMKVLLSCASNFIYSENNNVRDREFLESSVRNLFSELAHLSCNASEPNVSGSLQNQFPESYQQVSGSSQNYSPDRNGQISRPLQQNIEMKRGDWICPRCSFMNFARNKKCLECEEVRPKRQLTGGEWECPQCDFFNYGRNTVCLRCECKRHVEVSHGIRDSGGYVGDNYENNADINKRLAENEEKARRWFSKISQMDSTSDMSSAVEDEDFPEIMPLRKGVNRFVVSTRKTPLERRLADAQYRRNSSYAGDSGISNAQGSATNKQTPMQALDGIVGRRFAASDSKAIGTEQNSRTDASYGTPSGSSSNYVPFVPLPADMFAKKTENEKTDESSEVEGDKYRPLSSGAGEQTVSAFGRNDYDNSGPSTHPSDQSVINEQEEKQNEQSNGWSERVAESNNVSNLASAIPDEEFHDTMPMRKGENRFVVSKKKNRSLSSPMYERRMAMEQANNTNYVPFVPFPPDYFAIKDTQPSDGASMTNKDLGETSKSSTQANISEESNDIGARAISQAEVPILEKQQYNTASWNQLPTGTIGELPARMTSGQNVVDPQFDMTDSRSSQFSLNEDNLGQRNAMANSRRTYFQEGSNSNNIGHPYSQNENFNQMRNSGSSKPQPVENESSSNTWSGKSLEGSLVKEPDPLDMSEEAKAERWFRRVAQIKDISELSQIPDEDFPSIMPMRKGVNRFVVSKRKTPLERRLTSTQYRKNLPTVRSDPAKEDDSS